MSVHHLLVADVNLRKPGKDMKSPSKFVKRAMKVKGVMDAFRTVGRFDAVVFIHGETDEESLDGLKAIQKIRNVRSVEALMGYPGLPAPTPAPPSGPVVVRAGVGATLRK